MSRPNRVKVAVDEARCQGHGRCYALAPSVFGADEVGKSQLVRTEVEGRDADLARTAELNCPEKAIRVTDA